MSLSVIDMATKPTQKRLGSRLQDKSKDSESSINLSGKRTITEVPADVAELQRLYDLERLHSRRLEEELKSKEDRFKRKEAQYVRLLDEYEKELHFRTDTALSPVTEQSAKYLNNIKALHGQVMGMVGSLQGTTAHVLALQEKDIVRRFNIKLNDLKTNLEKEKKAKIESVETNAEHEVQRAHELELLRASIELVENQNKELQAQNRELRLAAKSQEDTNMELVGKLVFAKKKIVSLTEETERYRSSPNLQTQSLEVFPRLTSSDRLIEPIQTDPSRYEVSIQHFKRMLELERRNCKQARAALVNEMRSRTELEQILRKCIDDIREDLAGLQTDTPSFNTELGRVERERLVEQLLGQEKVLSMLHDLAFPRPIRSG